MTNREDHHGLSQGLAHVVAGCYVLTMQDLSHGPAGVLLSFVQQIGLEPPRIALSLHKERSIVPLLDRKNQFVLNICADGESELRTAFGEKNGHQERIFAAAGAVPTGPGFVFPQAAAHLVCRVVERVDIGDHWLYISDVLDGAAVDGRKAYVHIRRSGLHY